MILHREPEPKRATPEAEFAAVAALLDAWDEGVAVVDGVTAIARRVDGVLHIEVSAER